MLQGVAGDCNSPGETHAWFDSKDAHHFTLSKGVATTMIETMEVMSHQVLK